MLELLAHSHIIISTMPAAGWNNVIAEGMACGLVPLTTIAGVKDFVVNEMNGMIFKLNNHESFLDGLRFICEDSQRFLRMSLSAKTMIQRFSWKRYITDFLQTIQTWSAKK